MEYRELDAAMIKRLVEAKGRKSIARMLDVETATVYKWERGERRPSSTAVLILEAMGNKEFYHRTSEKFFITEALAIYRALKEVFEPDQ